MRQSERNVVTCYLLLSTASRTGMAFIATSYSLYLASYHLNPFQVNLVNFAFWTTLLICELPTGITADLYSRKRCYILASFLVAVGYSLYAAGSGFWMFVGAEVVVAIGSSLANGAFQAWMVDQLEEHPQAEARLVRILSRESWYGSVGCMAGGVVGAWLTTHSASSPWYAGSAVLAGVGIVAIFWMREESRFQRGQLTQSVGKRVLHVSGAALSKGITEPSFRFILGGTMLMSLAVQATNMQWQPWFSHFLPGKMALGYLFTGMMAASALGAAIMPRLLRQRGDLRFWLELAYLTVGGGIVLTVQLSSIGLILPAFLLHEVARGVIQPLKNAYLNQHITGAERATLLSLGTVPSHLGGMFGLLASGYIATRLSIPAAWTYSGLSLMLGVLLLSRDG